MKKLLLLVMLVVLSVSFASCRAADRVSHNLSRDADEFRISRRIVFYNSIKDVYILQIEGYCSILADTSDNQLEVTCKVGEGLYQKHFLGLSDNVTYTVEQLSESYASDYKYKIIFKPEMIIPIEIE